ncbi:hypothetical protein CYMTET_26121 [Cymbomonas tetramitiformis]|uniref:ERCC1-like central domain-containing protein n=1 Tax=Cymbomonas tetramitiformis TaxID=36881 RepID=A0AAE0FSE2_9CHLO|nr:hypothetical protein CYMTET_26121 [Cymbomonas tetramitiformis]
MKVDLDVRANEGTNKQWLLEKEAAMAALLVPARLRLEVTMAYYNFRFAPGDLDDGKRTNVWEERLGKNQQEYVCIMTLHPDLLWTTESSTTDGTFDFDQLEGEYSHSNQHGVLIIFSSAGILGSFDYAILIASLTEVVVLMSVVHTFVSYIALNFLGEKSVMYTNKAEEKLNSLATFAQFGAQALVASVVYDLLDVDSGGTLTKVELYVRIRRLFFRQLDVEDTARLVEFMMFIASKKNDDANMFQQECDGDNNGEPKKAEENHNWRMKPHKRYNQKKSITREEWVGVFCGSLSSIESFSRVVQHKVTQGHFQLNAVEFQVYKDAEAILAANGYGAADVERVGETAESHEDHSMDLVKYMDIKEVLRSHRVNPKRMDEHRTRQLAELYGNYTADEEEREARLNSLAVHTDHADHSLQLTMEAINRLRKELREEKLQNFNRYKTLTKNSAERSLRFTFDRAMDFDFLRKNTHTQGLSLPRRKGGASNGATQPPREAAPNARPPDQANSASRPPPSRGLQQPENSSNSGEESQGPSRPMQGVPLVSPQPTGGMNITTQPQAISIPPCPSKNFAASSSISLNSIQVNRRQEGNPVLRNFRNIRWQFADIVPDYMVGQNHCALYLSLRCVFGTFRLGVQTTPKRTHTLYFTTRPSFTGHYSLLDQKYLKVASLKGIMPSSSP